MCFFATILVSDLSTVHRGQCCKKRTTNVEVVFILTCDSGVLLCYMDILFLLIGVSLLVALFFLVSFIWAVKSGQYDDDYTPSVRMLFDDELKQKKNNGKI